MGYVPGISASCNGPIINHMPARRLPKDAVFKGFRIQVPENGFIYLDCHSAHNSPFVPLCKNTTFAEIMLRNECIITANGCNREGVAAAAGVKYKEDLSY